MIKTKYGISPRVYVGREKYGHGLSISFYRDDLTNEMAGKLEEDYKDDPFYGNTDFSKNIMIELFDNEKINTYIPADFDCEFYKIRVSIPFEAFKLPTINSEGK